MTTIYMVVTNDDFDAEVPMALFEHKAQALIFARQFGGKVKPYKVYATYGQAKVDYIQTLTTRGE